MSNFDLALTFDDVLLVPRYSGIRSRKDVSLATNLSAKNRFLLDLPFLSANMDTVTDWPMAMAMAEMGGLGVIHRFMGIERQVEAVKRLKEKNLKVGAAFGVKEGELDRARKLVEAGADCLVLDIAHGHSIRAIEAIHSFRKYFPKVFLIAGNVATARGVYDMASAGADAMKIGIGGGSVCITRLVTGFGVPQMTAIFECVRAAKRAKVGIIADGGIRGSGDIVKALAAGANAVMVGNVLAGTDQTPGEKIFDQNICYKQYRGMASREANLSRPDSVKGEQLIIEGISGLIPCRGDVQEVIKQLEGGLRSGLSYAGARNLKELKERARFIKVTSAGRVENSPHDIRWEEESFF